MTAIFVILQTAEICPQESAAADKALTIDEGIMLGINSVTVFGTDI